MQHFFKSGSWPCICLFSLVAAVKQQFSKIVAELIDSGYSITDHFMTASEVRTLVDEAHLLFEQGEFRHARVGTGEQLTKAPEIRSDRIHWIDPLALSCPQQTYWDRLGELKQSINSELFLGLFEFEGHLALYPPGSFYGKHFDRFEGTSHRVVTAILYLNESWQPKDGGLLRIYLNEDESEYRDIEPIAGRLVCFITERFLHEVLPAKSERLSLTGWFRVRPLQDEHPFVSIN